MKNTFYILSFFFFFSTCQTKSNDVETSKGIINDINTTNTKNLAILIFKKEKEIEIWKGNKHIESFSAKSIQQLPIGIFKIKTNTTESKDQNTIQLIYPNDFYKDKLSNTDLDKQIKDIYLTQLKNKNGVLFAKDNFSTIRTNVQNSLNPNVYIFPNDSRNGGHLLPSNNCPHWMAELYASLDLHLKLFKQD